jgi:hypothetical protein
MSLGRDQVEINWQTARQSLNVIVDRQAAVLCAHRAPNRGMRLRSRGTTELLAAYLFGSFRVLLNRVFCLVARHPFERFQ